MFNRLQCSVNMTSVFMGLALCWYLLYSSDLEWTHSIPKVCLYHSPATAFSSLAWSSVIENSNNCFLQKKYLKTHFGWETGTVINFTWGDNFCPFYGTAVSITDNELPIILIYADLLAPLLRNIQWLLLSSLLVYRTLFVLI